MKGFIAFLLVAALLLVLLPVGMGMAPCPECTQGGPGWAFSLCLAVLMSLMLPIALGLVPIESYPSRSSGLLLPAGVDEPPRSAT